MKLEYFKVTPTRDQPDSTNLVQHLSSLHNLDDDNTDPSLISTIKEATIGTSTIVPRFAFLMLTEGGIGGNAPVEFLYGTGDDWMNTLRHTLETAYPQSFDIERVEIDRRRKLIMPAEFAANNFVDQLKNDDLLYTPEQSTAGYRTPDEYSVGSDQVNTRRQEPTVGEFKDVPPSSISFQTDANQPQSRQQDNQVPPPLAALDNSLLSEISPPSAINSSQPVTALDSPTLTEDGTVMARPSLENCEPIAVRWNGKGERKLDWMTTLEFYEDLMEGEDEDATAGRSPLAAIIDFMAQADFPLAFQAVFQRKPDWTQKARRRKFNVHTRRDTPGQKVREFIADAIHGDSRERRRELRRRPIDDLGETVSRDDAPSTGEVADRQSLIDLKEPYRTFKANVRAVAAAPTEAEATRIEREMQDLTSRLSVINGYYYHLKPEVIRNTDERFFDGKPPGTREFERFLKRELVTGSGKLRPDLILNTQELANFVTVPSQESLTTQGGRGSRGEAASRDPLPRPHSDLMRHFHEDGMEIGYACDKRDDPEDVPTSIPPRLLDTHYARFAATGGGKSVSLINDILSLYENTGGPTILIDPKGDGMPEQYMKSHFERYGEQDLRENVIYFDLPEVLPGFTFFDIRAELEEGMRRVDAIQHKADHYIEIMQLVMGEEQFQSSKVAPTLMKAIIKALFDSQHGKEQYRSTHIDRDRESSDFYSHDDLEHAAEELQKYVTHRDDPESDLGSLPETTDDRIRRTLTRHAQSDQRDFSTIIEAVFNRLDYIREDTHLRRIFDNTEPKFDFRDHLDEDTVILFDLGGLRDEAAKIMTGLILTNLWDGIQNHDQHHCERGHESIRDCQQYAQEQGADPHNPPCRTPWGDDHMVNLLIDEAASVAMSDVMSKLFEQGRSFNLSVGLAAQFPSQMESASNQRTYNNLFNNIGTLLFGQLQLEQDVAEVLSHENIDTQEFQNRISNLPKGEWIAQLPSPQFGKTGPEPFTILPLEPPSGHDDSNNPLSPANEQYLQRLVEQQIMSGAQQAYGVPREAYENAGATSDDVDFDTINDGEAQPASPSQHSTNGSGTDEDKPRNKDSGGSDAPIPRPSSDRTVQSSLPEHVSGGGWGFHCTECDTEYLQSERDKAAHCCTDRSHPDSQPNTRSETTSPTDPTDPPTSGGSSTGTPHEGAPAGGTTSNQQAGASARKTDTQPNPELATSPHRTIPTHGGKCAHYDLLSVIRQADLSEAEVERRPVNHQTLNFMATILAVMNNDTPIPRYASLRPLREEFKARSVDIDHLVDEGYITPHRIPTITYTVEDKGKKLLGEDDHVKAGRGIGDIGDGMPHRFGADLAIEWLARQPHIEEVQSFCSFGDEDHEILDVVGFTPADGPPKVDTIIEVEGGRSSTEAAKHSTQIKSGGHNYASFAKDFDLMARLEQDDKAVDGGARSVWVVRNRDIGHTILDALAARNRIDVEPDTLKAASNRSIEELNETLREHDIPGLSAMYTFHSLQKRI